MTPRVRNELRCIALLAFAFLIIFHREIFLGQTFIGGDILYQNYPRMMFIKERLLSGETPLWSPYIYAGFPLAAEAQSAVFYPPAELLLLVLPRDWCVNGLILSHLFAAAVFMYLFCRILGVGQAGALTAAMAYSVNPFTLSKLQHVNAIYTIAWIPLVLSLIEIMLRRRGRSAVGAAAAAGAAAACMALAGHPQYALYGIICATVFFFIRTFSLKVSFRQTASCVSVIFFTSALLAAVQFVPMLELARLSVRAAGSNFQYMFSGSFSPSMFITWLLPHFYGAPWDATNRISDSYEPYAAVMPIILMLAVFAVIGRGRATSKRPVMIYAVLCLLGIVLALGSHLPTAKLFFHTPVLNMFRCQSRAMIIFIFGASVLGGIGLDTLMKKETETNWYTFMSRLFSVAASIAMSALILLIIFKTPIAGFLFDKFAPGAGALHTHAFYENKINLLLGLFRRDILMLAASFFLLSRLLKSAYKKSMSWLPVVIILFLVIDAAGISRTFANRTDRGVLTYEPPAVQRLREDSPESRIYARPPARFLKAAAEPNAIRPDARYWRKNMDTLDFELPMLFRIPSINGYGSMALRDFISASHLGEYIHQKQKYIPDRMRKLRTTMNAGDIDPKSRIGRETLSLLRVRYVIQPNPHAPSQLERIETVPAQARMSPAMLFCHDRRLKYDYIFDPVSPPAESGLSPSPVLVSRPAAGRIHIRTSLACDGEFVLMEKYYPGWRVSEIMPDGSTRRLKEFEKFGIGVRLKRGAHNLEYVFAPKTARLGLILGFLGLALSIVFVSFGKTDNANQNLK